MSSHWFTGYLVLSANTGAMIQVPCIYLFFLFLPLPLPKHLKAKQQSSCCQRTRNPRAAPHSQAPETTTASPMRASSVPCAKRKARDEDFRHLDRDSRGATFGSMAPSTTGSCHRHSSQSWRWINVNYHWITLLWLMTVLYLFHFISTLQWKVWIVWSQYLRMHWSVCVHHALCLARQEYVNGNPPGPRCCLQLPSETSMIASKAIFHFPYQIDIHDLEFSLQTNSIRVSNKFNHIQ